MTEAQIITNMQSMMELTLVGLSVYFTVVSAYVVALFYFLHRAPWVLKLVVFIFFTMICVFMATYTHGAQDHSRALQTALLDLERNGQTLTAVGKAALRRVDTKMEFLVQVSTLVVQLLVYGTLFFFTFFHDWNRRRKAP